MNILSYFNLDKEFCGQESVDLLLIPKDKHCTTTSVTRYGHTEGPIVRTLNTWTGL